MFTGSVGSCAVVPYLVNWFIFISFYFGVILYHIIILLCCFLGSSPARYGTFHLVSTCKKIKFNPLRWFVDKNQL